MNIIKKSFVRFGLILFYSCPALAYEVNVNDVIYYVDLEAGRASVGIGNKASGRVVIESSVTYNGKSYKVTAIEDEAFMQNEEIMSVYIPSSVESIGQNSFAECYALATVTLNNGLKTIGDYAFDTSVIDEISLPASLAKIGEGAFEYCNNLKKFIVESGNPYFGTVDGVLYDYYKKTLLIYPCGKGANYSVPSGTVSIGENAFACCETIQSISFPNSLTRISDHAFEYCTNLSSVKISQNISDIGYGAFRGCTSLQKFVVDVNNAYYKELDGVLFSENTLWAFPSGRKGQYVIPDNVSGITVSAFEDSQLEEVSIPSSVTSILGLAFAGSALNNVYCYNEKPLSIYENVFSAVDADLWVPYKSVTLYENAKGWNTLNVRPIYPDNNFVYEGIHYHLDFGKKTASISAKAEKYSGDIAIPESIVYSEESFKVTSLENSAFENCSDVTSLTLPASISSIGTDAFTGCTSLIKLVYLNTAPFEIYNNVFAPISEFCTLYVPFGSSVSFKAAQGWKDFKNIQEIVPEEITLNAIKYRLDVENRTAFVRANNYSGNISIPAEIIFGGVKFTVAAIEERAFRNCTTLTSVILPHTIISIGDYAFLGCTQLNELIVRMTNPASTNANAFNTIASSAVLYVPENCYSLFHNEAGWNIFSNIEEMKNNVTIDNISCQIDYDNLSAVVTNAVADEHRVITIPQTVTSHHFDLNVNSVSSSAIDGQTTIAAMVWNASATIPVGLLDGIVNPNFILYVDQIEKAQSFGGNIVVNGSASSPIILVDAKDNDFYCPKDFKAAYISYSHYYSMQSGDGECRGWETIALPFDVKDISHSEKGTLVPFTSTSQGKHFWLCKLTSDGFVYTSEMKANEPYIISMPNNSRYDEDNNINGFVTFSATNVTVKASSVPSMPVFNGKKFVPSFLNQQSDDTIFPLNVTNQFFNNESERIEGSTFISGLRGVKPFEAYITTGNAVASRCYSISEGMITGINNIMSKKANSNTIYNLSGQRLSSPKRGFNIINGKKVIVTR